MHKEQYQELVIEDFYLLTNSLYQHIIDELFNIRPQLIMMTESMCFTKEEQGFFAFSSFVYILLPDSVYLCMV